MDDAVHKLLENFVPIGTFSYAALVSREPRCEDFAENVRAAAIAATLGLKSVDYAKRHYCNEEHDLYPAKTQLFKIVEAYTEAYHFTNCYIRNCIASLNSKRQPPPSAGELTASVALERLRSSFFCAHLMYRLGHLYEGHAVSRLILEQLAWAYVAKQTQDAGIEKISATRAVTKLKALVPQAGELYGLLSKKTHIEYSTHLEFLRKNDDGFAIIYAYAPYILPECGSVILLLGDLFGLVYEVSQFKYIASPQAVEQRKGGAAV